MNLRSRCRARVADCFAPVTLLSLAMLAAGSAIARPCAQQQDVTIGENTEWHCDIPVASRQLLLIRAQQHNLDVTLAVVAANGAEMAVDAPTRRTTPELLLFGPGPATKVEVFVRASDAERTRGEVDVSIEPIAGTEATPLVRGLRLLTRSAIEDRDTSPARALRRLEDLRGARVALLEARAADLAADAQLRIAAVNFWIINDWARAASEAQEAMVAYAALGDPLMQAQAAIIRSASLIETANAIKSPGRRGRGATGQSAFNEPTNLLAAAAQAFHAAGRFYDEAQATNYLGIASHYQGDYAQARANYLKAARIYAELGDRRSRVLPLQNIAMIDYEAGDYARAVDSYDSLLGALSPDENAVHYVAVLLNRGTAQYVLGEFEKSLQSLLAALRLSQEHGFVQEEARSFHILGMVYLLIGERDRAAAFLERGLSIRQQQAEQNPRGLQTSLLRVGTMKRERGDELGALKLHLEALERAMTATQKALALHAIGLDHEANHNFDSATRAYEAGLGTGLSSDSPVIAMINASYGRARLANGDEGGRAMVLEAARLHERHGDEDLAAQAYLALAREDSRVDKLEAAVSSLGKALALFDAQHLRALNPDLRATYLASRSEAFDLQADLYMKMAERQTTPVERRRLEQLALMTIETNRLAALEDFRELATRTNGAGAGAGDPAVLALDSQIAAKRHRLAVILEQPNPSPDAIAALRDDIGMLRTQLDLAQARKRGAQPADLSDGARPAALKAVQANLAPDAAILAYHLAEGRSWVWCVTRQSITAHPLRERADIEYAARELRSLWSAPITPKEGFERELVASRTILGPVSPALRGKRTIVVVADGTLRMVPFGALWIEETPGAPTRLQDRHAVTFTPALSTRSATPPTGDSNRILLIGDPTFSAADSRAPAATDPWSWQPLPGSRREVQAIASIASDRPSDWRSYVLLGAEATKPALLSMPLDSFRAIHFATHARLDVEDPQLSSIALSSRDAGVDVQGATLSAREIVGFRLHAETVVLSACEASLGKNYRGQLSFGLSEAFLLAGARNVLGSLWRVSDDAAQAYMRHFYEHYIRHGATPVAAAQAAARALSRDPQFRHPYFWAAFVVTQR